MTSFAASYICDVRIDFEISPKLISEAIKNLSLYDKNTAKRPCWTVAANGSNTFTAPSHASAQIDLTCRTWIGRECVEVAVKTITVAAAAIPVVSIIVVSITVSVFGEANVS